MSLKVATYNVHRSIGVDGKHDPFRTAAVIREIDPAVMALQEVEHHRHDPDILARETGMTAIPGHTMAGSDSSYGNLLLTRLTVEKADNVDLSWGRREPRGAIDALLRTDGDECLRCLATHLGLSRRERIYQRHLLTTLLSQEWSGPTLLMGDFNEWYPFNGTIRSLNRLLGRSLPRRSFPSALPLLPLDRIWIRPANAMSAMSVWRSPLARIASDHLPVVAALEIH